jgi:hypothetical protein
MATALEMIQRGWFWVNVVANLEISQGPGSDLHGNYFVWKGYWLQGVPLEGETVDILNKDVPVERVEVVEVENSYPKVVVFLQRFGTHLRTLELLEEHGWKAEPMESEPPVAWFLSDHPNDFEEQ